MADGPHLCDPFSVELPGIEHITEIVLTCGNVGLEYATRREGTQNDHFEVDPVRTLLPEIERLGLATTAEIDIDTYADRVHDELIATGGVIVGRAEVGAWARVR
jgi:hypothetical protein